MPGSSCRTGVRDGAAGYGALAVNVGFSTAGNLLGGPLLITLTHTAQAKSG